jgi:phospholipid/cholesterol/gamma-HCH transport system substrate-binding protein
MRNHSLFDLALGAAILCVAVGFLVYMRVETGIGGFSAYRLNAEMHSVDSLKPGTDVRVSGVKVGTITALALKPGGHRVTVSMDIRQGIPIPSDSKLAISSGIMSSSYLEIRPGHSGTMLAPGATLHAS